jgi:hypothetical protein
VRVPLWLKIAWTTWVVIWAPLAGDYYGAQVYLHFCDLGNFLILAALWLESPLIVSWQAVSLLFFQTLYLVDLVGALFSGTHIIGGTEYVFDVRIPLPIRLLALYHFVAPALLLWSVWRLGYDRRGLLYQVATLCLVIPINYFWRPERDVNWARGPFFRDQDIVPGFIYVAAYLVLVPLVVYFPTHLALRSFDRRFGAGRRQPR